MNRLITIIVVVLSLSVLVSATVLAAPGDQVSPPGPINPAAGCTGIGVAYDGINILFTCAGSAAVYKTDTSGANLGSVATADSNGSAVQLDAIAWDASEGVLWGGDLGGNQCHIYSVDMSSGLATLRFSFADAHGGCGSNFSFYDGITVDPTDNTLWLSPDIHTHIHHYTKAGVELAADLINFSSDTTGKCPWAQGFGNVGCWNSGLAMGLDGQLFAGTASDGKIWQIDPDTLTYTPFATVGGRDEDLECGPLTKGLETILSRDFETGRIDLLEAPDGTCVVTEITLDPPSAENDLTVDQNHNVTATVTVNGQPLQGVNVKFSIVSGPNNGQVSDPGECSVDPNCNTYAVGQTSWSYTSVGLGVDQITACYTTAGGTEHCAEATKDWRDLTPPELSCTETTNPHGKKTPPAGSTTLPGSKGGQNEDGFYLVEASDVLDPKLDIWVSGFGPYVSGDKLKVTEAPGATPSEKKMGSANGQAAAIAAHLTLNADPVVVVTDASGNKTTVACLVPPPPK